MDELSLLEAEAIPEVADLASAYSSLPAPDFTGSLDYIDSLASRSALAISRRDILGITAGLNSFDYLSPLLDSRPAPSTIDQSFSVSSDFRPLGDARRYDPEGIFRAQPSLVRSSSRVVVNPRPRSEFPPDFVNPLDPDRNVGDLNRTFADIERRTFRHPFAFRRPNQVVTCLKRKLRRKMMHAMGFSGMLGNPGFRAPRRTFYSRIVC